MSVKISFENCKKYIDYLNSQIIGETYKLDCIAKKNKKVWYILYCNDRLIATGTLREISCYLIGLAKGYGIEKT